jgi:PP-loop superfamily ATP-utilizing enzyme
MIKERITRQEIETYKREILESSVLVRFDEATAILAVSPSTLRRRVEEKKITPYGDNRSRQHMRFLASELQRYVSEMRIEMAE